QIGSGSTDFWPGGNGGLDPFNGTIDQMVLTADGQGVYSAQQLVFQPTSPVTLPNGLIHDATSLSVDVTFSTTQGGVILGYQNQPLGNTPSNYVPALYVGTDGRLYGELWNGAVNPLRSGTAVNDGGSHHAILNWDGSTLTLTLDRTQVGQLTGAFDPQN